MSSVQTIEFGTMRQISGFPARYEVWSWRDNPQLFGHAAHWVGEENCSTRAEAIAVAERLAASEPGVRFRITHAYLAEIEPQNADYTVAHAAQSADYAKLNADFRSRLDRGMGAQPCVNGSKVN